MAIFPKRRLHATCSSVLIASAVVLSAAGGAAGRDLYVDPRTGDDRADGLAPAPHDSSGPVKTIARGIKLAGPGDTVHLAPVAFRESVVFHNRRGEPGRPLTLDGHGATIEGSEPLRPTEWEQVSPGLYRNDRLLRPDLVTRDSAVVGRWFFLFDGRISHMGRTSKGPSQPLKRPEDLAPDEWTIIPKEHAFYVRIDPARTLAEARVAAPVRSSAVVLSGDCAHIVVRNLTGTHVHNDGFNIHGVTRDARFENIAAIECGDDGFSAHDDCQVRVDGFKSIGNSTGITNVGHSQSENRRVWIEDCLGFDLYFLDEGSKRIGPRGSSRHTVSDSVIVSSAARCLMADGSKGLGAPCRVTLENVLIRRAGTPEKIVVHKNTVLTADRIATSGVDLDARGGTVKLHHSRIGGHPGTKVVLQPGVTWEADHNLYGVKAIQWGGTTYDPARLADYRGASGQDGHSRWDPSSSMETETPSQDSAGVDAARLPTR